MERFKKKFTNNKRLVRIASVGSMLLMSQVVAALTVGNMASEITGSFVNLTKLITAGSYLAGLAFAIGAIMKFKQHKDN